MGNALLQAPEKQDKFQWTPEAQQAFDELKKFLTNPPVLVPPIPEEPLLLYITATSHVVSEVLSETKIRYPQVQKIIYVVLITSRKLVHYFQAHPILVVTSFPIGEIRHNCDATGRIAKWAVELRSFELTYQPRMAIKSQALINFIAEWTEVQTPAITEKVEYWTMYFDGSLMIEGVGASIVLISPIGDRLKYVLQIYFPASNNAAEYEALLHGLR